MKKKYLVTGGAGFIGSHLTEKLLKAGGQVTVIDNLSTGKIDNLSGVIENEDLNVIIDSILNDSLMEKLITETDEIYHLASSVGVELIMKQPIQTIENIFQGTAVVLKHASKYGNVFKGELKKINFQKNFFDVILIHHVIEHIHKPELFIAEVNNFV